MINSLAAGSRPRAGHQALWRRWVVATTAGELLGFSVPAAVGAVAYALGTSPAVLFVALVAAGAAEGSLLALGQSYILRRELDGFATRAWVGATALAASCAWSIGLLPSTLGDSLGEIPLALLIPAAFVLGTALLFSIGAAQWCVLRRYVGGASTWIWANALAWLAGLAVSVPLMSALITEDTSAVGAAAIGVVAGLIMGLVVAAVTGAFLIRLVRPRR